MIRYKQYSTDIKLLRDDCNWKTLTRLQETHPVQGRLGVWIYGVCILNQKERD